MSSSQEVPTMILCLNSLFGSLSTPYIVHLKCFLCLLEQSLTKYSVLFNCMFVCMNK